MLAPAGVVIGGPQGPPDEAELLRKEAVETTKGFVTTVAAPKGTPIAVYTVQLDPKTRRGADITVQALRADLSLTVRLDNANPGVGRVPASLTIEGGSSTATAQFAPLSAGSTVVSVVTPEGFTKPGNNAALTAIVRP